MRVLKVTRRHGTSQPLSRLHVLAHEKSMCFRLVASPSQTNQKKK